MGMEARAMTESVHHGPAYNIRNVTLAANRKRTTA